MHNKAEIFKKSAFDTSFIIKKKKSNFYWRQKLNLKKSVLILKIALCHFSFLEQTLHV